MGITSISKRGTPQLSSLMAKLKRLTDKRDNRGKRHELAFVLGGVVLAIIAGRSSVSSIQRFIHNRLDWLRRVLGYREAAAVSRAQLPRILDKVDWPALNEILEGQWGIRLERRGQAWYALDGKTLRGVAGHQERVLLAVSHQEGRTVAQQPMSGPKESEITAARTMLAATGLDKDKITLDALHFNPLSTGQINQAGGWFVIQLKDNQPLLAAQLSRLAAETTPLGRLQTVEQDHGRREIRQAIFFDLRHLDLEARWAESGLATLIVIARRTTELATQKCSAEVSFYCANVVINPAETALQEELFRAIRGHWTVEANNYIRDVTFQEDQVRTKLPTQAQVLASFRTVAMQLFREAGLSNFKAALETFADCPDQFEIFLAQYGFL